MYYIRLLIEPKFIPIFDTRRIRTTLELFHVLLYMYKT